MTVRKAAYVLAALLISWPTLRLRGGYFAIATIAFAEIVRTFILNEQDLTNGPRGLIGYDQGWNSIKQARTFTSRAKLRFSRR